MEGPRSVRPNVANDRHFLASDGGSATSSEFEQAYGIRGPKAPKWMPALRKPQPFIDEGGHTLILERDERTNSELPRDGLGLPRIPTQQVGQGEGLGHADRAARQETLQGQEVLRVCCVGLVAALEDGATDEVRPGSDGLSLCHGRAMRTQGGSYSLCREIIRQMTKFPSSVEDRAVAARFTDRCSLACTRIDGR